MTPRARWWAPHVAIAIINAIAAAGLAWSGQWLAALMSLCFGAVMVMARVTQRHAFVHGWCNGYREGLGDMSIYRAGSSPTSLVRQRVTGSIAPEPWEDR